MKKMKKIFQHNEIQKNNKISRKMLKLQMQGMLAYGKKDNKKQY